MTDNVITPTTITDKIKENELKAARYDQLMATAFNLNSSRCHHFVPGLNPPQPYHLSVFCGEKKFEEYLDNLIAKNRTT